ncbi:uncharacterized protein A4U43_C07F13620 [Asparagus officinalis]|uniref:Uncharacterized protein n=1 Tax=Asparagus officinalis TaxID=4686 RepID=A0A5P1EDP1_ASPOF|nr:uncharacterized protein A4U43_C07F13620 [Asparagus officinalis]
MMLKFAQSGAISGGYGYGNQNLNGFGRGPELKEYDEKMIVQIYRSLLVQSQLVAGGGAADRRCVVAAGAAHEIGRRRRREEAATVGERVRRKLLFLPLSMNVLREEVVSDARTLHGGLNKLTELLDVERVGICHQARSDSLLTSCTFRKLKESFFNGNTEKYVGVLYSLGVENGQNTH